MSLKSIKHAVKSIPILGPLAVSALRAVVPSRPRYPASPLVRAEVMSALALAVEYVYAAEVEGHIAEFGTFSGETAETLAGAIVECETLYSWPGRAVPRKDIHLFDSFKGLPRFESETDLDSVHARSGAWAPGACFALSRSQLESGLRRVIAPGRVVIHEGWYRETASALPGSLSFSLAHLDCDLYQSTLDALAPLLERRQLSPGAVILFDDWNANRAAPESGERRAWAELASRYAVRFSDEGGYGCMGRRFIVHSYGERP